MSKTVQRDQKAYQTVGYEGPDWGSVVKENRGLYPEPNDGISEEEYRFAMESIRISREQYARGEYSTHEEVMARIKAKYPWIGE